MAIGQDASHGPLQRPELSEAIKQQTVGAQREADVGSRASTELLAIELELANAELRTVRAEERYRLKTGMARANARIQSLTAADKEIATERDRLHKALKESEA